MRSLVDLRLEVKSDVLRSANSLLVTMANNIGMTTFLRPPPVSEFLDNLEATSLQK